MSLEPERVERLRKKLYEKAKRGDTSQGKIGKLTRLPSAERANSKTAPKT